MHIGGWDCAIVEIKYFRGLVDLYDYRSGQSHLAPAVALFSLRIHSQLVKQLVIHRGLYSVLASFFEETEISDDRDCVPLFAGGILVFSSNE